VDDLASRAPRVTCDACRRPAEFCYCALLPRLAPRTQVLILQHPRERAVAIGTARMAHLSLSGSRLLQGVFFDEHPALAPLLDDEDVALLFPGAGARPLEDWVRRPPHTLIIPDGTWSQAKKLLRVNPALARVPRLSYRPPAPGNYRIRKEPADDCLATIEAIAAVLGALEGDPAAYAALLTPFDDMVARQLAAAATARLHRRRQRRRPPTPLVELAPLLENPARALLLYAEANCHPRHQRAPGAPELLHLVAARPALGLRFEAVLRPRRPLASTAPERLGLSSRALLEGESVESALARFRDFCGDDALFCAWGAYPRDLLSREGEPKRGFLDLRALAARALGGSPGGLDVGAQRLSAQPSPSDPTRAGRMLHLLEGTLEELLSRCAAALPS
jgi:DTW domain-containing protein